MPGDAPAFPRPHGARQAPKGGFFRARDLVGRSTNTPVAGEGLTRVGGHIKREAKAQHHAG